MVRPVLEYGSACWDPCRGGEIYALGRVQQEAAQFADRTEDSDWETLAQRRTIARECGLFKAYCVERAWKAIRDRLRGACCLGRVGHVLKIRETEQRTDIGKYSFVNRSLKTGTNYLQKCEGLFLANLKFLERELGEPL